ncbi:MAG TPA: hypothetical protein VEL47_06570, partial [Myxococcota bacterium]|nr:hypothetical protein [Myxococcota bacterium]
EPRNKFNGSRFFNFEVDLKILTNSSSWRSLNAARIRNAHYGVPSQDNRPERSWGCGPNSGARSLLLLGFENIDFDNFVAACPKSWSLFADVGPTPRQLAEYLHKRPGPYIVRAQFEDYFSDALASIKSSVDNDMPTIVLLIRTTRSMHYVNIIGYNNTEQKIAVMDTDEVIYWLTYDDLKFWMDAGWHFLQLFWIDDFNVITFKW